MKKCENCEGHGYVADYGAFGLDFYGPKECKKCQGSGYKIPKQKKFKCPISYEGCTEYCGSYGCGG